MAREISLTQGLVTLVDDGDFEEVSKFKWYAHRSGYHRSFHVRRNKIENGKKSCALLHREILKPPSGVSVDHKDGNALNNQRENLRLCTNSQNCHNKLKPRTKFVPSSKYKGVKLKKTKSDNGKVYTCWEVYINVQGKRIFVGGFKHEEDAALAYNMAAIEYVGEFALLNKIE